MLKIPRRNQLWTIILLLVFLLRLPSLFEPYWYGDEGVYLAVGQALQKGKFLYREVFDNKTPLIYLLAAVSGNLFWFRFFLLISVLFSTFLFCRLAEKFFPSKIAKIISCLVFVVFSSTPFIEGNITNSEILQILPTLLAISLLVAEKRSNQKFFFTGFLFGISLLLKVPAGFDFLAILVFLVLNSNLNSKRKSLFVLGQPTFFLILGFLSPVLITLLYFLKNHFLEEFVQITFFQNLGYLSSWQTGSHQQSLLQSGLSIKLLILGLLTGIILMVKKIINNYWASLVQLWFVFSLFGSLLSNRPYGHYLLQVLAPACFLIGFIFSGKMIVQAFSFGLLAILLLVWNLIKFWSYPVFSYYSNFANFMIGRKTQIQYFSFFDKKVPDLYRVANYLVVSTRPKEAIFIWADEPTIYALSKRLSTSRFLAAYHIIDFNKFKEVQESLAKEPPEIIVFDSNKKGIFKELENLIETQYLKIQKFNNFEIYYQITNED